MALSACVGRVWSLCCQWASMGAPGYWVWSDQASFRAVVTVNFRPLFLCCAPGSFHRWAGPTVRPDVFSAHCWGYELVYVVIFLSLQGRRHFGVVLALSGLLILCYTCGTTLNFCWGWVGGSQNMGTGYTVLAKFAQVGYERGPVAALENCWGWGGGGPGLQKSKGTGHAINKLCGECSCYTGPFMCPCI